MDPNKTITLKDIAAKANLSVAAVSMALRNKPSLPKKTKERVKKIAQELGYVPDPALSALAARRVNPKPYKSVIALISNWDKREGWLTDDGANEIIKGAKERASQLGYDLQHIWAREENMNDERLSNVLIARGIKGIILSNCQSNADTPLNLNWDAFSITSIENPVIYPAIHNITQNQYAATYICWEKLLLHGYSRVGMVVPAGLSDRWGNRWDAAHSLNQSLHEAPEDIIPTLRVKGRENIGEIKKWIREHRPDAVISRVPYFREAVEAEGIRIPDDIGYISLNIKDDKQPDASGIVQHREEMGSVAVETLHSLLQSYKKGLTPISRCTQIVGSWQDGNTLLPARQLASKTTLVP